MIFVVWSKEKKLKSKKKTELFVWKYKLYRYLDTHKIIRKQSEKPTAIKTLIHFRKALFNILFEQENVKAIEETRKIFIVIYNPKWKKQSQI